MFQRRWRKQHGETALEHADSQQRRLQTGTATRSLTNLEQQLAIRSGVAERADNTVVAVHLDSEAKTSQQPPQRKIPRHQQQRERHDEKKTLVACFPMLVLVAEDVLSLNPWQCQYPSRDQDARANQSERRRTH